MTDADLSRIAAQVRALARGSGAPEEKLQKICELLRDSVPHYDWVGFYLVRGSEELVLGPFAGAPTEHVRIKFGQGICGQAAERLEVFVVQDVSKEDNYLSCSPEVRSEIVMPVFRDGVLVGELDIDSHSIAPFTQEDREFLEEVCREIAFLL
ncbi:MAG: GAF domain-containing protein [Euryarchaeota archaeon]|nr:GAF domain-containing protein [Euryarchaeota archaeon]